ncbi:hypothetical protein CDAR_36701 [Caerostris darwini]|uniref:Uncharacterized protein n=1 Tax=Caerostris darwini TaxID=1538125 RepID=A0AAV4UWK5_9ARAC|nr:hypothetical protein CDAR_36701 [Caerostris darwini]
MILQKKNVTEQLLTESERIEQKRNMKVKTSQLLEVEHTEDQCFRKIQLVKKAQNVEESKAFMADTNITFLTAEVTDLEKFLIDSAATSPCCKNRLVLTFLKKVCVFTSR